MATLKNMGKIVNKTMGFDSTREKIFFTSDTHFGHKLMLRFRPFDTVEEMNTALIQNWNKVVNKDDTVFLLGDFAFASQATQNYIFNALNGKKHLILGNHDKIVFGDWLTVSNGRPIRIFDPELQVKNIHIYLSHYPMLSWYLSHKGSWQLYGHLHGKTSNKDLADDGWSIGDKLSPRQLEIGTDCFNFTPIEYQEVKKIILNNIHNAKK